MRLRMSAGTSTIDDAATVATRARSGVTSPRPSGCTRFERNTTNIPVAGSSHSDVPVNPVWPNDPTGSSSPRLDENVESMSHPRPRTFRSPGDVACVVIFATASGDRIRTPRYTPPSRSMRLKIARSAAVLKRPACPATPPIRRAVGSWTVPRSIDMSGPWQGQPSGVQLSVGAIRRRTAAGGRNIVSFMPSGAKMRSCANRSSGAPLTRRTMSPSRK